MSGVNKFKQSVEGVKAKSNIINNINNNINDNNIINNINSDINSKFSIPELSEVVKNIPERQEAKKIISFSLSPAIIQAIEKAAKKNKIARSKLVENILMAVLVDNASKT